MKRTVQLVSLLLAAALVAALVCSCAGDTGSSGNTTSGGTAETETETADPRDIDDGLPDVTYDGATFTLFCQTSHLNEFFLEADTGDIVDDAIVARNRKEEERFNIKLETYDTEWNWGPYMNLMRSNILAGDNGISLYEGDTVIAMLMGEKLFNNWNSFDYIDFSKPWWSIKSNSALDMGGLLEFVTGDLSLTLWKGLYVILFNKSLQDDCGIEDLYQLVDNGGWTLEKFISIGRSVSRDTNGDSEFGDGDLYGIALSNSNHLPNIMVACDQPYVKNDEDNFPYLSITEPAEMEKAISIVDMLCAAFADHSMTINYDIDLFKSGQAFLYGASLNSAKDYRALDTDFGIIPYPKYNEEQNEYYTFNKSGYSAFAIPVCAADADMSAVFTTALMAESYKSVIPAYYDVALKYKYTRDDESQAMLDIIRNGFNFDITYILFDKTMSISDIVKQIENNKGLNFNTKITQIAKTVTKNLEKLKEQILSIE